MRGLNVRSSVAMFAATVAALGMALPAEAGHGSSSSSGGYYYTSGGSSSSKGGSSSSHGGSSSSKGGSSSSHGGSSSSKGGSSSSHGGSSSSKGGSSSSHGGSSSSHGGSSSSGHVIHYHATPAAPAAPAAAPAPAPPEAAMLKLNVPANADVYLVGQKMTMTGTVRQFRIPVKAGKTYEYPIRVELKQDGRTMVTTLSEKVTAGATVEVDVKASDDLNALVAIGRN